MSFQRLFVLRGLVMRDSTELRIDPTTWASRCPLQLIAAIASTKRQEKINSQTKSN